MLKKRNVVAALVLGLGLVVGGEALAQGGKGPAKGSAKPPAAAPAAAPVNAATQEAEKHFEAGVALAAAVKWPDAYEEFRAAFAISKQPRYLAQLIQSEIATGRDCDALFHLDLLLEDQAALGQATTAAAQTKRTDLLLKLGLVKIEVNVEGADVRADGKSVGVSPLAGEICLREGEHSLEATKAGWEAPALKTTVKPGLGNTVTLTLKKTEGQVVVPPGGGGPNKTLVYAGIGVAGVLGLVGVGTMAASWVVYGKANDINNQDCVQSRGYDACKNDFDGYERTRVALNVTSLVTLIGAGVVGGATVVYALSGSKPAEPVKTTGTLVITRDRAEVVLMGVW